MTETHKTWLLIAATVILFCAAYGYELEYYRQQDAQAALDSYCARSGAVRSLCP
jgi:hypothetical protein